MTVEKERRHTPEALLAHSAMKHYELVEGRLVEKGSGAETAWITAQLCARLTTHSDTNSAAWVFPSTTGYRCFAAEGNRVRKPDVSPVWRARLPEIPVGFIPIRPDLAVEVVSPNEKRADVQVKVEEFLAACVPVVWVIDPDRRAVSVHAPGGVVRHLEASDQLTGGDVLPGFSCAVVELFPPLEAADRPDGEMRR